MNRYPLWKYLLILIIAVVGVIYALPNIYPPDPAIQIATTNAGVEFKQLNQSYYDVFVESKPVSVNAEAQKLPHQSVVRMSCSERDFELVNRNFPSSQMFQWNNLCTGLNIDIYVGRYKLNYRYAGALGFARFLEEFNNGSVRFEISRFPEFEDRLAQLGIDYIDLGFKFKQQAPVIKQLTLNDLAIPSSVAQCWDTQSVSMRL